MLTFHARAADALALPVQAQDQLGARVPPRPSRVRARQPCAVAAADVRGGAGRGIPPPELRHLLPLQRLPLRVRQRRRPPDLARPERVDEEPAGVAHGRVVRRPGAALHDPDLRAEQEGSEAQDGGGGGDEGGDDAAGGRRDGGRGEEQREPQRSAARGHSFL